MVSDKTLTRKKKSFILKIYAIHHRKGKKGMPDQTKAVAITRYFRKS